MMYDFNAYTDLSDYFNGKYTDNCDEWCKTCECLEKCQQGKVDECIYDTTTEWYTK